MTNHFCSAIIVHCMDWRLQAGLDKWLTEQGLSNQFDRLSIAGGVQALARPELGQKDFVLQQIATSQKLHQVSRVCLINHSDCGAYGGREGFASDQKEKTAHLIDMEIAQELIEANFPDLTVEIYYAQVKQAGTSWEVEIERQ